MTRAALLNGFRLIIALAVMLSAVPSLRASSSLHGLALASVLGDLSPASRLDQVVHGHSHDHDDADLGQDPDRGPEHKDHSHVTLGLTSSPASLTVPDGKILRREERCRDPARTACRLERPPRPASVA
jgi:hypothetical protein